MLASDSHKLVLVPDAAVSINRAGMAQKMKDSTIPDQNPDGDNTNFTITGKKCKQM